MSFETLKGYMAFSITTSYLKFKQALLATYMIVNEPQTAIKVRY